MTDRAAGVPAQTAKVGRRRIALSVTAAVVGFIVCYWTLGYLARTFTQETTDDAFLEGHVIAIAPKVAGLVGAVHVTHYQSVKKGDLLFEIDPRDFDVTLEQKKASLASAVANQQLIASGYALMRTRVETADASKRQAEADVAASRATQERADADFERSQGLIKQNVVSQQEYDAARAAAVSAKATVLSAEEKVLTETSRVKEAHDQLEAARSAFDQAKAQVVSANVEIKAAEFNVGYTQVTAPEDGTIARKNVEPGSYVQIGQQLLALVPVHYWVIANFKETQLARIRVGQEAEVEIDSVPGRIFHGKVESMQSGSGSRFSLLPPENAVGNFVKVVQRVPVKIRFTEPLASEHPLGPGLSVRPSVITSAFKLSEVLRTVLGLVMAACIAALVFWSLRGKPDEYAP